MATYSSWGGQNVHGDAAMLTDTLRGELGFTGFVVSDWAGYDQINPSSYGDSIVQYVNMGMQAGGWTQSWQGDSGDDIPGTTIASGI